MAKSRRANSVLFGFDFQVNAAILLMLENMEDLHSLRLEGNEEDIELRMSNGEHILAQAKGIEKGSTDFRNVRANLKKSLLTLSEGATRVHPRQLVVITNSFNPFNQETSHGIFNGFPTHRAYKDLPIDAQKLVDQYLKDIPQALDTDKLTIQTLPFETDDDDERYKCIMQAVNDFMGHLRVNIPGMGKQLLAMWQSDVFKNGSCKDASIELSKKELIWPMLVIITDIDLTDDDFIDSFDSDVYEEVVHYYKDLINSYCERFEFFVHVLCDYNNFKGNKSAAQKCAEFVDAKWKDYEDEFDVSSIGPEIREALTKIVLYNVVKRRIKINKIKQGVNL